MSAVASPPPDGLVLMHAEDAHGLITASVDKKTAWLEIAGPLGATVVRFNFASASVWVPVARVKELDGKLVGGASWALSPPSSG